MNSKLKVRRKKPAGGGAVAQKSQPFIRPTQVREQPEVPLKEVAVACEFKFTLTLTGEESPEHVAALILGRFDQSVAEKRVLLVNRSEVRRRAQMMLERAPDGRSSVNFWQWPIVPS